MWRRRRCRMKGPGPLRGLAGGVREMAATRPDMLDRTAERLLRQAFETEEAAPADARATASAPATTLDDIQEPTDAELAELTAAEEDALYGKGAGHYGGADGSEDAFQSYLHDIRGLSLLSHEEEIILAKRAQG